jgi:hypothetical protein
LNRLCLFAVSIPSNNAIGIRSVRFGAADAVGLEREIIPLAGQHQGERVDRGDYS